MRRNTKKYFTALFIIICLVTIICDDTIVGWVDSLRWHASNDSLVPIGDAVVNLPLRWSVYEYSNESVVINRAAGLSGNFCQVTLKKDSFGFEKLSHAKEQMTQGDVSLEKEGSVKEFMSGNNKMFEVSYKVVAPEEKEGKFYWLMSIPEMEISMIASGVSLKDKSLIKQELLPNIFSQNETGETVKPGTEHVL